MEKIDWQRKLTSRKFWMALAGLVIGILTLFKMDADTVTQIGGLVITFGSVVAFIIGEGLVDAAAAGATVNINGNPTITAGDKATTPDNTPVIGSVDPSAADGTPTGAAQAAAVKQDTALSGQSNQV